jgi:hypothetical protein
MVKWGVGLRGPLNVLSRDPRKHPPGCSEIQMRAARASLMSSRPSQ